MRVLLALATTVLALLALAGTASAEPPLHDSFSIHLTEVDTQTCSFPVVRDWVFTNDITEFLDADGNLTKVQLHQSSVGTLTANGVSLRLNIRETIMVEFAGRHPCDGEARWPARLHRRVAGATRLPQDRPGCLRGRRCIRRPADRTPRTARRLRSRSSSAPRSHDPNRVLDDAALKRSLSQLHPRPAPSWPPASVRPGPVD